MKAELLIDEHYVLDRRTFVEIVVWRLDRPARGSIHRFKYRLALVADSMCVLRYDNEGAKVTIGTLAMPRSAIIS
jgi:Family of unknown function (DUF6516)